MTTEINISKEIGEKLYALLDEKNTKASTSSRATLVVSSSLLTLLTIVFFTGGHLRTLENTTKLAELNNNRLRDVESKLVMLDRACIDIKEMSQKIDDLWKYRYNGTRTKD